MNLRLELMDHKVKNLAGYRIFDLQIFGSGWDARGVERFIENIFLYIRLFNFDLQPSRDVFWGNTFEEGIDAFGIADLWKNFHEQSLSQ